MSWEDRLQQAIYKNGDTSQEFEYENVSMSVTNRGAAFNFPNSQGTYIQRSGTTGRKFPLKCYFHGEDYDEECDAFMSLLRTAGVGKLQHPIYGTIDVVPLGEISRGDALMSGAGVGIITVTFLETTGVVFPTGLDDPETQVSNAITSYVNAAANEYEDNVNLDNQIAKVDHRDKYVTKLSVSYEELKPLVSSGELLSRYNSTYNSIVFNIDSLLDEPITLARQTSALINLPPFSASNITAKLAAFTELMDALTENVPPNSNELASSFVYAFGVVGGSILSVVDADFQTQDEALSAAVYILDMFDTVNTWYDTSLAELGVIDTGRAYAAIQDAAAICAGFLIQISFTLKQEKIIVLTAPRNMIELIYELYGELDDQYDFFINSNNLTGDEIIELPAGKTIRYYV